MAHCGEYDGFAMELCCSEQCSQECGAEKEMSSLFAQSCYGFIEQHLQDETMHHYLCHARGHPRSQRIIRLEKTSKTITCNL